MKYQRLYRMLAVCWLALTSTALHAQIQPEFTGSNTPGFQTAPRSQTPPPANADEQDDLANFSVRQNSRRLFAFTELKQNTSTDIQAYTYRYPKNTHPNKIIRRALKYEIQLAENSAGRRPRTRHNPIRIRNTSRQNLNNRDFNSMRYSIANKHYEFFAFSHKNQVVVVRASITNNDASRAQELMPQVNATVKCLCSGRC